MQVKFLTRYLSTAPVLLMVTLVAVAFLLGYFVYFIPDRLYFPA